MSEETRKATITVTLSPCGGVHHYLDGVYHPDRIDVGQEVITPGICRETTLDSWREDWLDSCEYTPIEQSMRAAYDLLSSLREQCIGGLVHDTGGWAEAAAEVHTEIGTHITAALAAATWLDDENELLDRCDTVAYEVSCVIETIDGVDYYAAIEWPDAAARECTEFAELCEEMRDSYTGGTKDRVTQ